MHRPITLHPSHPQDENRYKFYKTKGGKSKIGGCLRLSQPVSSQQKQLAPLNLLALIEYINTTKVLQNQKAAINLMTLRCKNNEFGAVNQRRRRVTRVLVHINLITTINRSQLVKNKASHQKKCHI